MQHFKNGSRNGFKTPIHLDFTAHDRSTLGNAAQNKAVRVSNSGRLFYLYLFFICAW